MMADAGVLEAAIANAVRKHELAHASLDQGANQLGSIQQGEARLGQQAVVQLIDQERRIARNEAGRQAQQLSFRRPQGAVERVRSLAVPSTWGSTVYCGSSIAFKAGILLGSSVTK